MVYAGIKPLAKISIVLFQFLDTLILTCVQNIFPHESIIVSQHFILWQVAESGYISLRALLINNFDDFYADTLGKDIIAALYTRLDSRCGAVYFGYYTLAMTDPLSMSIIARANEDLSQAGYTTASADMVVVITWENMYPRPCEHYSNKDLYPELEVIHLPFYKH